MWFPYYRRPALQPPGKAGREWQQTTDILAQFLTLEPGEK